MEIKTITIDGTEHPVEKFGAQIQQLLKIRAIWDADLQKERLAVAKSETAIKTLDLEILALAQKELNPPADPGPQTEA